MLRFCWLCGYFVVADARIVLDFNGVSMLLESGRPSKSHEANYQILGKIWSGRLGGGNFYCKFHEKLSSNAPYNYSAPLGISNSQGSL